MTTKFQGWRLPPFGAIVAVSRIFHRSSSATSSGCRRRIAFCVYAVSKKSMSFPPALRLSRNGGRRSSAGGRALAALWRAHCDLRLDLERAIVPADGDAAGGAHGAAGGEGCFGALEDRRPLYAELH